MNPLIRDDLVPISFFLPLLLYSDMKLKVLFDFTNGYTGSRISFIYIARFIDLLKKVTPYIFLYIVIVLTHRAMFYLAKKK